MSRREPSPEAFLIGQALFAPNDERGIDAFIQLRDRCDKRKVFTQLKEAFTSPLPLSKKIIAYKHLCSMDTHKVFLNYLHSRLPEILDVLSSPDDKEQFLLTAWAESHDVVIKRRLQAIANPTQLATLEIQFPDITDKSQQDALMSIIEKGNETAMLYWQIKQPTLLRAVTPRVTDEAKAGSVDDDSDNDSEDGSYIDNNLMLMDMLEHPELFICKKVAEDDADDGIVREVVTLHPERIQRLKQYLEFKLSQHATSPFYNRLACEVLSELRGICGTHELDTDIVKYKVHASIYGDIAYSREMHTNSSPAELLERTKIQDKAAIYMLHALAGVPIAECDNNAVSDLLIRMTPDLQRGYRQTLAECYLMGYSVSKDVMYANQLLGLDTSLTPSIVAEQKHGSGASGAALTVELKAQQALYDCPYSMRFGEVTTRSTEELMAFKQKQISTHMLNIGCPLEAVTGYRKILPGISVGDEVLEGSYEQYTSQSMAEHFSNYIKIPGIATEQFSGDDLKVLQTNVYTNLTSADASLPDAIYERLRRGEVVNVYSGWSGKALGHVLQCSFKMINGECYLMYANSGAGSERTGSGITLFHVGNPDMLASPGFVKRIQRGFSNLGFVVSLDKRRHGLGRDLQLTPVGFVPKKPQKNGNCGVKAAKNQVLMHLMYAKLAASCRSEGCPPNQALFERSHQIAYEWYKPFVAYSRQQSVLSALKFCDVSYPAHIELAQFAHVIQQILDYIKTKDTTNPADLMQLLLPVQQFLRVTDMGDRDKLLTQAQDIKIQLLGNTVAKDVQHISAVLDAFTPDELAPHTALLNAVMIAAAKQGDIAGIQRCLESGCSVDYIEPIYNSTLLIEAASCGQTDCAKWLLDRGANPFKSDNEGKMAMDHARDNGHDHCLRVIEAYPDEPVPAPSALVRQSLLTQPRSAIGDTPACDEGNAASPHL
ncbi:MAG: ankyrin repeat domain-containing protein [Coxiellaceae bacterium]|nr:ankyrin repeat domain-containing protein [Coxiellaceae bacterium]